MPKVDVVDLNRKKVGELELADGVFGAEVKDHLHWEVVIAQRASKRRGTHSTKVRSAVAGGGKKPWKQKGTGRARAGSTRATQWVGGGKPFGPHPRDYSYRPTRKTRRAAICSAISLRLRDKNLIVVDKFALDRAKTKEAVSAFNRLGVSSALIIDSVENRNLWLSARNLKGVKMLAVAGLNVEDILKYDNLVLTVASAKAVEEVLAK
jgi:large subunit ribosomal protein L4